MTTLLESLAERHIVTAINNGDLDNLAGKGKPLKLDDDSQVPAHLRTSYRLLKNAGYLPPELQDRQEALELCDLLQACDVEGHATDAREILGKLRHLELKLRLKGMNTRFIQRYQDSLRTNTDLG